MDSPRQFAHTHPDFPQETEHWEPLFTNCEPDCPECRSLNNKHGHLNKTASLAAYFAKQLFPHNKTDAFTSSEWGFLLGIWHDLGKFSKEFQHYLESCCDIHESDTQGKVDHSSAGAQHAVHQHTTLGHLLAYIISGHHSGLLDSISDNASLENRLTKTIFDFSEAPKDLLNLSIPSLPECIQKDFSQDKLSPTCASYTRMLFSCLVDADFLATEAFMNPEQAILRAIHPTDLLSKMQAALESHLDSFGMPKTHVDQLRKDILEVCLKSAEQRAGLFSLTVPTGGGKTLSSLAFALKHALKHGQKRVIYVIPFTSIIEQNAAVFSDVFKGLDFDSSQPIIIEHHSNLSPDEETTQSRLATENWDAPLIVTTAVQFYESLHANKTSHCRKLHNIANSVIILDEAQCLPVDYLRPCLETLRQLTTHYNTSVVLCTATQPAIHQTERFPIGLENVHEIIPAPDKLYHELKRVKLKNRGALDDTSIAAELLNETQALVIVNTRKHAQVVFKLLPNNEENFHLSALMCPVHRKKILAKVRKRLDEKLPVRLISTQLIEAGVDVDFPCVYRSLAGIDSIAQAAGRCNRNGKAPYGSFHLFSSEHVKQEAYFRDTAQIASQMLELYQDPLSLESVAHFFSLYYHQHNPHDGHRWDSKSIIHDYALSQNQELPFLFQFKTIADKFRLIENNQIPIIVPYDENAIKCIEDLRNENIRLNRALLRKLQSYTVQIHPSDFHKNQSQFEPCRNAQFHCLICPELNYSDHYGLELNPSEQTALIF